jgi:molybdenum cofactor cytidylyltransferase
VNKEQTGVVILAAGASWRMGQPKQLLPYQGQPLLQHTLDVVANLPISTSVVVLGASADSICEAITPRTTKVLLHPDWTLGMASSLVAGLQDVLLRCPDIVHLMVLLSDQPFISQPFLEDLLDIHFREQPLITASQYGDTIGVPALFSREVFPELLALEGDRGANKLIKQYSERCVVVPFELGGIDVDTPFDYDKLIKDYKKSSMLE